MHWALPLAVTVIGLDDSDAWWIGPGRGVGPCRDLLGLLQARESAQRAAFREQRLGWTLVAHDGIEAGLCVGWAGWVGGPARSGSSRGSSGRWESRGRHWQAGVQPPPLKFNFNRHHTVFDAVTATRSLTSS